MASASWINTFNEQWRSSPMYREILASVGVDASKKFKLSDSQRKQVQAKLEGMGVNFRGNEIDAAGNMNEREGFVKELKKWGPIAGGAAAMACGIPGWMPGLIGGSGAAGAGAAGAAFDAVPNIATAAGAANAAALGGSAAAGGGGMFSTIAGLLRNPSTVASAAGRALGAGAQASAQNRGA